MRTLDLPEPWSQFTRIVSELAEDEVDGWLAPAEREVFASLRGPKRRLEWAASRIAAKQLAIDLGLCHRGEECSLPSVSERPRIELPGNPALSVSLSHSAGAGAAAIRRESIGIDLQEIREIQRGITKYYLHEDEEKTTRHLDLDHALLHFWAAKEAIWKLEPGEGWYRSSRVAVHEVHRDGVGLTWERSGSHGTATTMTIDGRLVLAVAQKTG